MTPLVSLMQYDPKQHNEINSQNVENLIKLEGSRFPENDSPGSVITYSDLTHKF